MLLEKHAEEMVSLGVNQIIFSLDGTREIHDKYEAPKEYLTRHLKVYKP
jgi:sulfatase maturation enzyme AslB (radical SAM superfamily)